MYMGIAIAAGVLFLLILLIWVIVRSSPQTYTAHIELFMKSSPEAIWAAMQDVEKHPVGVGMTKTVTPLADEHDQPVWEEDLGSTRITVRTIESVANSRLKRACRDDVVPMSAEIEITLEAVQGGTKINALNRTILRTGTWQVLIMRLVLRHTDALERGLKEYFRQLGRTLGAEPRFHVRPGQKSSH